MQSLVVFLALASVACGSYIPLAQPPHHPAVVLDPHGRPLDTAAVINARALHLQAKALEPHAAVAVAPVAVAPVAHSYVAPVAHSYVAPAVVAAPAAVSHQSRVDVRTSPAIVTAHAAPVVAAPLLGHSAYGVAGHGHYLGKRSLGHAIAYSAPIAVHAVHAAPAAVSHQSRVDVVSSPAIVSHAVAAPVVAHAVAPVAVAPAAVSHQSRVDVRTSPAVYAAAPVAHSAVYAAAPVAHSAVYAAPLAHSAAYAAPVHAAGHLAHAW